MHHFGIGRQIWLGWCFCYAKLLINSRLTPCAKTAASELSNKCPSERRPHCFLSLPYGVRVRRTPFVGQQRATASVGRTNFRHVAALVPSEVRLCSLGLLGMEPILRLQRGRTNSLRLNGPNNFSRTVVVCGGAAGVVVDIISYGNREKDLAYTSRHICRLVLTKVDHTHKRLASGGSTCALCADCHAT